METGRSTLRLLGRAPCHPLLACGARTLLLGTAHARLNLARHLASMRCYSEGSSGQHGVAGRLWD